MKKAKLSLCNEKPPVAGGVAVRRRDVGQFLLQRLAVDPGGAGQLPGDFALAASQLVRVLLGHRGLDAVLDAGDLGLDFFNHPLQLSDLVYLHVQFVSAHGSFSFQFMGLCVPLN